MSQCHMSQTLEKNANLHRLAFSLKEKRQIQSKTILTVDRPVTHAAGGGQGRDSGGQHSDNHLHGIAIRFEI